MKGKLENYLAYALKDGVLKGTLSHYSRFINANELMAMSSDEEEAAADTIASTLVEVPKNIYFVLTSKIDKILYDKLVITDTKGKITIRNGNVVLDGLDMALLDGRMNLTGKYSTENIKRPFVDFNVKVANNLSSPVMAVVSGQRKSVAEVLDSVQVMKGYPKRRSAGSFISRRQASQTVTSGETGVSFRVEASERMISKLS